MLSVKALKIRHKKTALTGSGLITNLLGIIMDISTAIKKHKGETFFCVYSLINGNEVIYVGSSRHISNRLGDHRASDKVFKAVNIKMCSTQKEMLSLEADMIVRLNPIHNKLLPCKKKYIRLGDCLEQSKVSISHLVKDLPRCFVRVTGSYLDVDVYNEFMDSLDEFANNKIALMIENSNSKSEESAPSESTNKSPVREL